LLQPAVLEENFVASTSMLQLKIAFRKYTKKYLVKKYTSLKALLLTLLSTVPVEVNAAEISKTPNAEMRCYLTVSGPIEAGDAERIGLAMANYESDHPEDQNLFYPNSMNSWRKVCFDSAGGSFTEGVKIAHFLWAEHIGSAVPREAKCVSACAVAFMGGTNDSKTDGGNVIFRQLHPLGKLGFHTPYIEVPERNYTSQVVQESFESALSGIGQLLSRGDEMHFPRSLLLRMLETPSSDMYFVETVGEASRWGIGIAPVAPKDVLEPASVINACYNHEYFLQDQELPIFPERRDVEMLNEEALWQGNLDYGFRGERALGCEISQYAATQHDRYGPLTHRARHFITENEAVYPYQMYDPLTPITALYDATGNPPARVPNFEASVEVNAVCLVVSQGRLTDSELCRREAVVTRDDSMAKKHSTRFHWPSGSKTIITEGDSLLKEPDLLNGVSARRVEIWRMPENLRMAIQRAAEALPQPADPYTSFLSEECWRNVATERLFCTATYDMSIILDVTDLSQ